MKFARISSYPVEAEAIVGRINLDPTCRNSVLHDNFSAWYLRYICEGVLPPNLLCTCPSSFWKTCDCLFICLFVDWFICSLRSSEFVLPSRGRRKMWRVWEKNQHQRLRILYTRRFWRSVGCGRDCKLELPWQKVSRKRGSGTTTTWPGNWVNTADN